MRILLVEDEPEMARLIAARLVAEGFVADWVTSLAEAEAATAIARYALVLLDRRLPDGDGAAFLRVLRRAQPGVPVILVSALDAIGERVAGLDAGADDYLTKPFDTQELLARIRAALRRPGGAAPPPITLGRIAFDPAMRQVAVGGQPVVLRRRELAILEALIGRAGRVVPRPLLVDAVFGFDDQVQENTLESHISRLRGRLTSLGAGVAIHPVRGVGYLLDAEA
jgi:DNA-binding response OmpR family regulator